MSAEEYLGTLTFGLAAGGATVALVGPGAILGFLIGGAILYALAKLVGRTPLVGADDFDPEEPGGPASRAEFNHPGYP